MQLSCKLKNDLCCSLFKSSTRVVCQFTWRMDTPPWYSSSWYNTALLGLLHRVVQCAWPCVHWSAHVAGAFTSQVHMSEQFAMFAVRWRLSIYVTELAGLASWVWALLWLHCSVITVLNFLISLIRIPHFHFALRHRNYIAILENRGWQLFLVKSQIEVFSTLHTLRANRASRIMCRNWNDYF